MCGVLSDGSGGSQIPALILAIVFASSISARRSLQPSSSPPSLTVYRSPCARTRSEYVMPPSVRVCLRMCPIGALPGDAISAPLVYRAREHLEARQLVVVGADRIGDVLTASEG